MPLAPYVPLTVGRGPQVTFTVSGHPGGIGADHLLLTEDGNPLLLESGEFILTA